MGVRVCYATNKDFVNSLNFENISDVVKHSRDNKMFLLSEDSETIILPLASYESDVLDEN